MQVYNSATMTLRPGARLGPYEVRSSLGAGAMGEVYLATDTRLGRSVAIKILLAHTSATPERRRRLAREARLISTLNHPNICSLYDVGEHDGMPFIVMEHLNGETLAQQLSRGPLPVHVAVRYASELADALSHAHRAGIIHRDLKPANVMISASGAKLLDFGLAGLQTSDTKESPHDPAAATITEEGTILGTISYMAPEQLEARALDGRADIFGFGAVLYEMLTGQRAFSGSSKPSIMAAILDREPRPPSLVRRERFPADTALPPLIDSIVTRCLAKNVEDRWQTAHDLHAALQWPLDLTADTRAAARSRSWWRRAPTGWRAATLIASVAVVVLISNWNQASPAVPNIQFLIPPPPGATFNPSHSFMSLSPDGRTLAFSASTSEGTTALWVRPLEATAARELPGTDGAVLPFWSADSRSIAFTTNDSLRSIEPTTGRIERIGAGTMVGTWNVDDVIVARKQFVGPEGPILWRIPAGGGEPTPATSPGLRASAPEFLPDGRRFLFVGMPPDAPPEQSQTVYVGTLDSRQSTPLFESDSPALYAAPGYVLYMRGYTLVAQRFDPDRLRPHGDPVPLVAQVDRPAGTGRAAFAVSQTGVLAYRLTAETELAWFDREGTALGAVGPSAHHANPALSPDGRHLAVQRLDPSSAQSSLWLVDLATRKEGRIGIATPDSSMPLWTPDSQHIVYRKRDAFYRMPMDATSEELLVSGLSRQATPLGWSADRRLLLFDDLSPATMLGLHLLSMENPRQRIPWIDSLFSEVQGQISPDGEWLAYVSNESGRSEIYVRPFPSGDRAWRVSSEGGLEPRWRLDGKELFYLALDGSLMAASVKRSPAFEPARPVRLFETRMATVRNGWFIRNQYVVAPDGRFLINQPRDVGAAITVETNWTARLPRR